HHIGKDLDIPRLILSLYPQIRSRRILDRIRDLAGDLRTFLRNDLTGDRAYSILCEDLSCDTVLEHQFLIKFIAADFREIVPARVKEHTCDKTFRTVYRKRFARTDLFVQLKQTLLIILSSVLSKACKDLRLFSKKLYDLGIRSDPERSDEHCDRHFSRPVNTHIENVIGVCLVFKPGASVRDH